MRLAASSNERSWLGACRGGKTCALAVFFCAFPAVACQSISANDQRSERTQERLNSTPTTDAAASVPAVVPTFADADLTPRVVSWTAPQNDAGVLPEAGALGGQAPAMAADTAPCFEREDVAQWCRGQRMFVCPKYGPALRQPLGLECKGSNIRPFLSERSRSILCCTAEGGAP
jgi:hypothetical protein